MIETGDLIADRYQAIRLLGTGGFSRVWEAVDLALQARKVAIKELAAPAAGTEDARRVPALFRREIEALSSLAHPGLPAIYDGFEDGGCYYLVLEYVPGEVLDQWRDKHLPSVDQVVEWGAEVTDILHYLHTRQDPLVMRDSKPSNLILAPDGKLRLIDLGIAAILRPHSNLSMTLAGYGTPGYAAPEQYGQHEVDVRADLYALGATLYFLLTGEAPPDAIDRMLGRAVVPPLLGLRPETPPGLAHCIQDGLLALEPSRRPASALATREWLLRGHGDEDTGEQTGRVHLTADRVLQGNAGRVLSVAFGHDGNRLICAGPDDAAQVWDTRSGGLLGTLAIDGARSTVVACSALGPLVALGGPETTIVVWDVDRFELVAELSDVPEGVTCIAFSPDGLFLAAGFWDKTIRLWDLASGIPRQTLRGHLSAVAAVAFSTDSRMLASASADCTVRLWSVASAGCVYQLAAHHGPVHSVCFIGDAGRVASASWDRTVVVWNTVQNVVLHRLHGHTDGVAGVAASPDGRFLASASWDSRVRLWDARSGSLLDTGVGHMAGVSSLAFSPDGTRLASGSRDTTARLWRFS